jgi:hypothetical protein
MEQTLARLDRASSSEDSILSCPKRNLDLAKVEPGRIRGVVTAPDCAEPATYSLSLEQSFGSRIVEQRDATFPCGSPFTIPNLSPVSRNGRLVELRLDLPEEDADIFRLGTVGRQGEDFLQLPAKMRAHRRFPEATDLGFLEFALVRRQSVALKTIILRRQLHPEYYSIVWFANTCAKPRASIAISRLSGRCLAINLPHLSLKLPTQAFVPSPNSHAKACPGQEMNSRKLNHVRDQCVLHQRFQAEGRPICA